MGAIAATNSTTQSVQSMLLQSRAEQARREADQAEAHARDLRAQADDEQRKASSSRNTQDALTTQARQLDAKAHAPAPPKPASDPTYGALVRPTVTTNPPADVANPQALQTVIIAKAVSTFKRFSQAGTTSGGTTPTLGGVLNVTA